MGAEIKRRLYRRGSSFETTIPMPILFALDLSKSHDVIFTFDNEKNRWYLNIEERKEQKESRRK